MSIPTTSEYPQLLEIDAGERTYDVMFTTSGEYLISGGHESVWVWRVKDGQQIATMAAKNGAFCVAASRDGKFIAAGSLWGDLAVWDATTYEQVFVDVVGSDIEDVEFSPDSTRLVFADFKLDSATTWDIAARQRVQTFHHHSVKTARYSPQGDRIATASHESIRIWDSSDGRLLVDVEAGVAVRGGLLWSDNHLFVQTSGEIKKINASTGSTVFGWPTPDADYHSCIALPQHGKYVAYFAGKTIAFLDTSANTHLTPIQHNDDIDSMSMSFDSQLITFRADRKIIVRVVSSVICPFVSASVSFSEPDYTAALNAWKRGQLTDAEGSLCAAIPRPDNSAHHVLLATRALVRARLEHWDAALVDANQSIKIQRSPLAYVAMCVALIGKGEKDEGIRVCDMAFKHFYSEHVPLLLLIKAVVLCLAGEHDQAISRVDDLITDSAHAWVDPALYTVQAYMRLLLGNKHMASGNYDCAIRLFDDARIKVGNHNCQPPPVVTLISGWSFEHISTIITQRLCEALLAADRPKEAGECVVSFLGEVINMIEPIETWVSDFKSRCRTGLEDRGDSAMSAKQFDEAISQYTVALSLDTATPQDLLVKRSKVYAEKGMWENALNDAEKIIKLTPSSPLGYERTYAALLGMGHHDGAIDAFETMLSKMSESSDPEIRERSRCYVRPEQTKEAIRASIRDVIRDSPLVLINALTGRLCDKSEQAAAFESTPACAALIASMTTCIDDTQIKYVVEEFYRYATFSHTWEGNEPLYEKVVKIVVYELEALPTHEKLRMFCKIVRDEGFNWAWSDTCCIDKGDHVVLQEALVSMFKWYEGSAMTIIFLCDVDRLAELGALMMSKWNSRGWTLQEYHASKVVRIYTKDWTPYLGLTISNHKESPEVIREMEDATGVSAESLKALRPGLQNIREKLRLASKRQTTRVEDAAYSLLGIFSMTLPATYGEGDKALGRLLSQLLTSSGDTSILAWTGRPGSFNSCLPINITVFSQSLTTHVPPAIPDAEMATITAGLQASSLDLDTVTALYDQLNALPLPSFMVQRMKLPCLAFKIRNVALIRKGSEVVFRAQANVLGIVEIKTRQNIADVDSLYLVHPWVDFLLDRHTTGNIAEIAPHQTETLEFDESLPFEDIPDTLDEDLDDLLLPSPIEPMMNVQMEFLARLKQPFGALLLAPTRRNVAEFRRIATENVITARVGEITSATVSRLITTVRVLDVL